MSRHEDLSRLNSRERSLREHSENEFRRLSLDVERQQQQLRFPFHHQPDELLRYENSHVLNIPLMYRFSRF